MPIIPNIANIMIGIMHPQFVSLELDAADGLDVNGGGDGVRVTDFICALTSFSIELFWLK